MIPNPTISSLTRDGSIVYTNNGPSFAISSHLLPFDVSGMIFSGLSGQSTLQVTARYYLERVPSANDINLITLTSLSNTFDPKILELYSRCVSEMPVAVAVGENPLGEWFDTLMDVLSVVSGFGAPIAAALNPGFGIGVKALGYGASALGAANRRARQNDQRKTTTTTVKTLPAPPRNPSRTVTRTAAPGRRRQPATRQVTKRVTTVRPRA
jgi:hypothetical protein